MQYQENSLSETKLLGRRQRFCATVLSKYYLSKEEPLFSFLQTQAVNPEQTVPACETGCFTTSLRLKKMVLAEVQLNVMPQAC